MQKQIGLFGIGMTWNEPMYKKLYFYHVHKKRSICFKIRTYCRPVRCPPTAFRTWPVIARELVQHHLGAFSRRSNTRLKNDKQQKYEKTLTGRPVQIVLLIVAFRYQTHELRGRSQTTPPKKLKLSARVRAFKVRNQISLTQSGHAHCGICSISVAFYRGSITKLCDGLRSATFSCVCGFRVLRFIMLRNFWRETL
jgi:hypothetical protein